MAKSAENHPFVTLLHQLQTALRELDEADHFVAAAHLPQVIDVLEGDLDQLR